MNSRITAFCCVAGLILTGLCFKAVAATVDRQKLMEETNVPPFTVPELMVLANGRKVESTNVWLQQRRPELMEMFRSLEYGHTPKASVPVRYSVEEFSTNALGGLAWRKQVALDCTGQPNGPKIHVLVYGPNRLVRGQKPAAFMGLNFGGNHRVHADPAILKFPQPRQDRTSGKVTVEMPGEDTRGKEVPQWQVERIIKQGYGLVTAWYGDIEPDFEGSKENYGVRPFVGKEDDWGAIGVWAWGLSRMLDFVEADGMLAPRKVIVIGHSRLGKTAVWAGAQDHRFAAVISNNSGCGGAALHKRIFGETIEVINTNFPHWFTANFKKFNGREAELPFDQHELLASIAPRPLYVASAEKDLWADPKGEFLGAKYAEPAYRLFGKKGLNVDAMPAVNEPVGGALRYHVRSGGHDVTEYDWVQYLKFADEELNHY